MSLLDRRQRPGRDDNTDGARDRHEERANERFASALELEPFLHGLGPFHGRSRSQVHLQRPQALSHGPRASAGTPALHRSACLRDRRGAPVSSSSGLRAACRLGQAPPRRLDRHAGSVRPNRTVDVVQIGQVLSRGVPAAQTAKSRSSREADAAGELRRLVRVSRAPQRAWQRGCISKGSSEDVMSRVPPPWVIDEIDRAHRQRSQRDQPRLDVPRPEPSRSGEDEPEPRVIVVVDAIAAGALTAG
jgi:hypothetical protein